MANFQDSETIVHTPQDLGRLVRAQRRASGLRIDDAVALCGVSVDLLSRLENGRSGVSSERLLKVLDGLGLAILILRDAHIHLLSDQRAGHRVIGVVDLT